MVSDIVKSPLRDQVSCATPTLTQQIRELNQVRSQMMTYEQKYNNVFEREEQSVQSDQRKHEIERQKNIKEM